MTKGYGLRASGFGRTGAAGLVEVALRHALVLAILLGARAASADEPVPGPPAAPPVMPEGVPEGGPEGGPQPPPPGTMVLREPRRPFETGTQQIGLLLGYSSSFGDSAFSFGASYGYYVLPGLSLGLQVVGTAASKSANTLEVSPLVRYVLYRSYDFSPFVLGKVGRLFVAEGIDDLTILGAGGGAVVFLSSHLGLTITALYEVYTPDSVCGRNCDSTSVGLGLGYFP